MNKKEKSKHVIAEETQKETSVSSAPVDCYVPESKEPVIPPRVKQELSGEGTPEKAILERSNGYHSLFGSVLI